MTSNIVSHKLTRRTFLKASAATAAVVAVGDKLFGGPMSTLVESAAAAPVTEDVWFRTICRGCFAYCGVRVHRVDGVVVKLEGNPEDPRSGGRNCARSQAVLMDLYNPYRPKAPLQRTNPEKGPLVDPKWKEISWEEALDIVASRLRKVRAEDPRKFTLMPGRSREIDWTRGTYSLPKAWPKAYGTPNSHLGGIICHGGTLHIWGWLTHGADITAMDVPLNKFRISIGTSTGTLGKGAPRDVREFFDARERGAKSVVVDPVLGPSQVMADEWIPIRPGTDAAFMFAMIYTILYEIGVYDVDFLKARTNAPYLIGDDGHYIRGKGPLVSDPVRKEMVGPPLIWDNADSTAKPFNDPRLKSPALEGTYVVEGKPCRPAFHILKEHFKHYTPEWAEEISTVPAATIKRLARELVNAASIGSTCVLDGVTFSYRPVTVTTGKGSACTIHGGNVFHAALILDMLMGSHAGPGGTIAGRAYRCLPNPADGVLQPIKLAAYRPLSYPPQRTDLFDLFPVAYCSAEHCWHVFLKPEKYGLEYKPEVLGVVGSSAPASLADPDYINKSLRSFPFIFVLSVNFDELSEQADIVLPETNWLEQDIFRYAGLGIALAPKAVQHPTFESRDGNTILMDLAERVGFLLGDGGVNDMLNKEYRLKKSYQMQLDRRYSWGEVLDRRFKSMCGDKYGLDWFRANHTFQTPPMTAEKKYGVTAWPKIRFPIYMEYWAWVRERWGTELKKFGVELEPSNEFVLQELRVLPVWDPDPTFFAPPEFDLWAIHYKTMTSTMSMPMENAWIGELTLKLDPHSMYVWMNRATASNKNLKDGDVVWIESATGTRTRGELRTSECVHPEAVGFGGCHGHRALGVNPFAREGPHFNTLMSIQPEYVNSAFGICNTRAKVKVYKA